MTDNLDKTVRRKAKHTLPNGKEVEIHGLGLTDYVQAREQALKEFKRLRIETYTSNIDLLDLMDAEERKGMIRDAFERAELLTYDNLPAKEMLLPLRYRDGKFRRDKKTGELLTKTQRVEYTAWWMSETPEGRLFMTWLSIRRGDPDFTLADADEIFREHMEELESIADEVGEISQADLGNSSTPPEEDLPVAGETKRQAKKRRRRRRTGP